MAERTRCTTNGLPLLFKWHVWFTGMSIPVCTLGFLPCIGTKASPTSCRRALWHPIETSSPMSCNPPRSRSLQGRKGNIQQANMILQMLRWVYYLKVTSTHWLSCPTPPRTEAIRLSICPDLRFISSCMLYKGLKLTCYTL